jgi:hypothetical protein
MIGSLVHGLEKGKPRTDLNHFGSVFDQNQKQSVFFGLDRQFHWVFFIRLHP